MCDLGKALTKRKGIGGLGTKFRSPSFSRSEKKGANKGESGGESSLQLLCLVGAGAGRT